MKTYFRGLMLVFCSISLLAQATNKKAYEFRGTVTRVDASEKSLTVDGEAVPGWMDAMKMSYAVDNEGVLKSIKPGDHIAASVYDGDMVLHNVHVVKDKTGGANKK